MNFNTDDAFPNELIRLAKISKNDVFDKFGPEVFQKVVYDVLTGKNVREFTEGLTRTRLLESNLSLMSFYIKEMEKGNTPKNLYLSAKNALIKKEYKSKYKPALEWLVMMTNKQTQNVLRDAHDDGFGRLTERTQEQVIETIKEYNTTINKIKINDIDISLEDFCYMLLSLGSQTLTIRGSEKSLHGKYFEKLILGSLFTILGFEYTESLEENLDRKCFTLSLRSDDRESDATVLFDRKLIRVDIGFIGRGNTEISLDKVSRFRWMDAIGGITHHVNTMVIVDVIGDGSRIGNIAEEIDGKIEAMSNPFWVKNVANYVSEKLGVENLFSGCETLKDIQNKISQRLKSVDLEKFIQM